MKIAYHYHHELQRYKNEYFCTAFWGKYVTEISLNVDLTLLAWVKEVDIKPNLYLLPQKNLSIINFGPKPQKFIYHFIFLPRIRKIILKNKQIKLVDYIGIEAPTFFGIYIYFFIKKSFFVFVVGDMPACVLKDTTSFFKKLILYTYYSIDKYFLLKICNKSVVFDENMKISNRELHKIKKKDEKFVHKFLWLKEGFQNFVSKNSLVKTSSIKQLKDHYRLIKVTRHNMLMPTFHSKDVYYKPSKEFKRSPKIFIILTVFRLDQGNNIFSIINIAENLALKTQNFKWHIVGDGPDKTEFIKRLKIKKLENFFKLFGHIEHGNKFKNILKSSDIFVDPYLPNGPGPNRAAWEALSLGLPLVGGSSCRKNYLIHEKHIYYANDDSSTGFSQAICDLIYDKKKRCIISKNASDIAKIRSLDYEVKRLVSILQSKLLLNCKTHPKR